MEVLRQIHFDERGATTTEYVIIVSLVAIGLIGLITSFSEEIGQVFKTATNDLGNRVDGYTVN